MRKASIVATGAYLPGDPITNEQLEHFAGGVPENVLEGLQVKTRHWLADPASGEQSQTNSGMAYEAVVQALERAGVEPDEIDLLVVSTASPEYHLPPTSTFVQERLGLRACTSIDIRSGCAGAVEALDLARLNIERGLHETAVVVGSEAISPLMVPLFRNGPDKVRMRDKLGAYSFGDGAGAMVLKPTDVDEEGIQGSALACVGGQRKPGMQVIGGGTHAPIQEQLAAKQLIEMKVDVVESGRFTPHVLTEALQETLRRSSVEADAVKLCLIPEGNAPYMTDELRDAGLLTPEWLALEHRIFENLALVGATGSAAVPLALDYAWTTGAVEQGDMLMLLAIETSKWKYGGMVLPWVAEPIAAADQAGREAQTAG